MAATRTEPTIKRLGPDEDDNLAHVLMGINDAARDRLIAEGGKARALCGKWWAPTTEGAELPMCEPCWAEYLRLTGKAA